MYPSLLWSEFVRLNHIKNLNLIEQKRAYDRYQQELLQEYLMRQDTMPVNAVAGGGSTAQASVAITDSDVLAFIAASGITNATQRSAVNTLVTSLKGYSIWAKLNAIYPFVGGTASTHKWNLKDPRDLDAAYRLEFFGGWTHNANGITGNGTNALANTFYAPGTINTIGAYNRTATTNLTLLGATFTGIDSEDIQTNPIGLVLRSNNMSVGFVGNTLSAGTPTPAGITVSRTAGDGATAIKVYRNGTQNSTGNNNDWVQAIQVGVPPMIIGARRQDDYSYEGELLATTYTDHSTANIALAFIGNTALTGTEVANLNTAIVAYQTTLSRQV